MSTTNAVSGKKRGKSKSASAKNYNHPTSDSPMRPEVGTQAQFKKRLPPKKYRYDDSLSPALEWDGQNPARERGEALIQQALEAETLEAAKSAVAKLTAMGKPFLNWAGKAERLSFDVPTLPLFIHERLSTKAILETLKGHKRDRQTDMFDLFGDPQHPKNVRPPAKTLSLSAEAMIPNGAEKPAAFVFGPESGAVSEKLVYEAAKEANAKSYAHLYVIGFAIQPNRSNAC